MKSRYQTARKRLIFWTLFIGIGAVAGAACMLIEPSGSIMGMDAMLPYFQVLPFASVLFQNFTFSGIALLIVNGLAAPMRAFCMAAKGKIHQADYILVHHNCSDYRSAADEMDRLLGIKRTGLRSVCCREGRYLSERRIEDSKKSNCTIMH